MQESGQWSEHGVVNMVTLTWSVLDQSNRTLCSDSYEADGWLCTTSCDGVVSLNDVLFQFGPLSLQNLDIVLFLCPWFSIILLFCNVNTTYASVQFSSVSQSCPTLCDPMNCSTPGCLVHHQILEFTQTHVHRVSDAIQPSHPLLSPFPPSPNPSQHQSLFQWVNSSHKVAKVLEVQL